MKYLTNIYIRANVFWKVGNHSIFLNPSRESIYPTFTFLAKPTSQKILPLNKNFLKYLY